MAEFDDNGFFREGGRGECQERSERPEHGFHGGLLEQPLDVVDCQHTLPANVEERRKKEKAVLPVATAKATFLRKREFSNRSALFTWSPLLRGRLPEFFIGTFPC